MEIKCRIIGTRNGVTKLLALNGAFRNEEWFADGVLGKPGDEIGVNDFHLKDDIESDESKKYYD